MTEPRTPEAERHALDSLIHSDGWQIVKDIVRDAYGPEAFERAFDEAMAELRPGDDERAVTTQIRAAFKAARDVTARVESRFQQLDKAEQGKKSPLDAFAAFRRGPKSA